jgi:cytochrome c peroxidase
VLFIPHAYLILYITKSSIMRKKSFHYLIISGFIFTVALYSCNKDHEFQDLPVANAAGGAAAMNMTLDPMAQLGKNIFFDKISQPINMSCATCHAPEYGFTGPNSGQNVQSGIYRGAIAYRFGNRKPPSSAYATFSPVFHYEIEEGLFEGGNFWDGRATGERLGNPAAEQALGPFMNPVEQNHPSKESVLQEIAKSRYALLWKEVWGSPITLDTREAIDLNYDRVGLAIAAYEASSEVNQFSSKYDAYLRGEVELNAQEQLGLMLFNGKADCFKCHPSVNDDIDAPLFTDYTFDNLGVPKNPGNPFYKMNSVFLEGGQAINPQGAAWIDYGLGGFLANHSNPDWKAMANENMGKHKVPTLRNVGKKPGPGNTKAYMHNGVFKSLKEVVHFYNTAGIPGMWPSPEVPMNVNREELGNLGLTEMEEDAIVAFMHTLSDGWMKK